MLTDQKTDVRHIKFTRINENILAREIAAEEGNQKQIDIAQIKEILAITLDLLGDAWAGGNEFAVIDLIKRHSPDVKARDERPNKMD